jgi:hypothetical protein
MSSANSISVFQDLRLHRGAHSLESLRDAILARVDVPWRHAKEREAMAAQVGMQPEECLVFERAADDVLPAVGLVFWREAEGYHVSNVVPIDSGRLSHDEYNRAVQDFGERIVGPAAADLGLAVELTAGAESLEDWMSSASGERLRRFSRGANKSTGSSHPCDRERWFAFICGVHAEGCDLDTDKLARWLIEVERWHEEGAHDLTIEYEFARELLKHYDGSR